jgi:RNA polymerase sigma factor (TIGR02999 family)
MMCSMSDITQILASISQGDAAAKAKLLPVVYEELRRIARSRMAREQVDHTLQATALVHEAYLRLLGNQDPRYDGRAHFFATAAEAMRRILIEHARRKRALKHGGDRSPVEWNDDLPDIKAPCHDLDELLSLDEALDRLADQLPEEAKLIELLYFVGLNLDQAAEVMGISRTTAYRRWQFARAWLYEAISGTPRST